ncbi:MAG: entericidin, EcnA/B family [Leptolyngbya sp. PLA3]|nr:MAG: entericidin A/B family lipoprotein [Cyanobacteria bacterium CYA]MCE7968314.1 entericidin, EcnA/B family [Leptolyngbya sp. PL-A3]
MSKRFGRVFMGALLSAVCLAVTACNTVEGVGKDIKAGGQAIENAAN